MPGGKIGSAVLSMRGLVSVLVLLALLAGGATSLLSSWSEDRAIASAVDSAQVVSNLVVRGTLDPDLDTGLAAPNLLQTFDLQRDLNLLHADRRLVGLQVWRTDGTSLFVDAALGGGRRALPADVRQRAVAGKTSAVPTGATPGRPATLDVYLPHLDADGRGVAVTLVMLPEQALAGGVRQANLVFRLCLAVLLLAVFATLLVLRGRLQAREHEARHDSLTGLLNRAALLQDGEASLRQEWSEEGSGRVTALLVIDLDGFKTINDTLGHAAGDALLVQVASTLSSSVRTSDLVYRLGGDEFAVVLRHLLPGTGPLEVSRAVLAHLRAARFACEGVALAVDASLGVAVFPEHGRHVPELLQHADVAMYQAKAAGGGVVLYDPASDHHDVGQLALLLELQEALETDRLVLHYQPQVDLRSGEVIGMEALVRWDHPTRGLLPPSAFLPLAEPTDLMDAVTAWVLRAAVGQAATWLRAGTPLRVAVNISPRSLLKRNLVAEVVGVLEASDLPPALLELEITETAVMTDHQRAAEALRDLDRAGIRVVIDDFGSGYSSLAYLRLLPVAGLKVDRALVSDVLSSSKHEAILTAVVGLGHRLGLVVLAEGVEDAAVGERLMRMGCDEVQGFGISHPLPAPAVAAWVANWSSGRHEMAPPRAMSSAERPAGAPSPRAALAPVGSARDPDRCQLARHLS